MPNRPLRTPPQSPSGMTPGPGAPIRTTLPSQPPRTRKSKRRRPNPPTWKPPPARTTRPRPRTRSRRSLRSLPRRSRRSRARRRNRPLRRPRRRLRRLWSRRPPSHPRSPRPRRRPRSRRDPLRSRGRAGRRLGFRTGMSGSGCWSGWNRGSRRSSGSRGISGTRGPATRPLRRRRTRWRSRELLARSHRLRWCRRCGRRNRGRSSLRRRRGPGKGAGRPRRGSR